MKTKEKKKEKKRKIAKNVSRHYIFSRERRFAVLIGFNLLILLIQRYGIIFFIETAGVEGRGRVNTHADPVKNLIPVRIKQSTKRESRLYASLTTRSYPMRAA